MNYIYNQAVPVWGNNLSNEWNQFLGFCTELEVEAETQLQIAVAARSFYRMYVNGEMVAHGPAQAGHGYARVDQISITVTGKAVLAFEVTAYNKPDKYSNAITLEPGMLCCEIMAGEKVLAATGWEQGNSFVYQELTYRNPMVELLSHSREIMEVYTLANQDYDWRLGVGEMEKPVAVEENLPVFLTRRAPYADYTRREFTKLLKVADSLPANEEPKLKMEPVLFMQAKWCSMLPERIVPKVMLEREALFSGKVEKENGWMVKPGNHAACLTWDLGESVVGFPELLVEVMEEAVIDLLHSDILDKEGRPAENPCMVRYQLKQGTYHLICYEPYLVRYMKVILRTGGIVNIKRIGVIDYMYSDKEKGIFLCSDNELNLIYEGARRTLRNNMLDIFMDCPERERAGWLCDSLWSARAAWMLFGDLAVEKDFLENFLLTDADRYRSSFFPEVYPGSKGKEKDTGIMSWSFWLAMELCEYYVRSGDREFVDRFRERMERFVEGILSFTGESGLLENIPDLFVDWSDSNYASNLYPISVPVNLLAAYALESLGELYGEASWKAEGGKIRSRLVEPPFMMLGEPLAGAFTDAVSYQDGHLVSGQGMTEAGIALELWSGLGKMPGKEALVRAFVEKMGTCPKKAPNIQVARANLFIGLAIRLDVLSRLEEIDTLVKELKDIYLPQMLHGPGTLFEGVSKDGICGSLCHGFNGHAGVLLMRDVLGIGEPGLLTKSIRIAPHPLGLHWAMGKVSCQDGEISVDWKSDYVQKKFGMNIKVPEGWKADIVYPKELEGWDITVNRHPIKNQTIKI
ncbi:MAG TPA: hypothetical protein GXX75_15440 [Clostridiales bacterium]|nr:hypothetical protein [Clostridiales bacterium]